MFVWLCVVLVYLSNPSPSLSVCLSVCLSQSKEGPYLGPCPVVSSSSITIAALITTGCFSHSCSFFVVNVTNVALEEKNNICVHSVFFQYG